MGVPTFFKWLSIKYPLIVKEIIEGENQKIHSLRDGVKNYALVEHPNGVFDNLYLDLNGVIHQCTHPRDDKFVATEKEMFERIFKYIDRLMSIIKPRNLLFLAIDGVAPRAKMNQQRSRRYKYQSEVLLDSELYETLKAEFEKVGKSVPAKADFWDTNVISPGTQFLSKLSIALRYYINNRFASNIEWKDLTVIFSDSTSPGEGEHKIMQYIRSQRTYEGYNPNTIHCIHGCDADLIMLGLATHEPNFFIIRESICDSSSQYTYRENTDDSADPVVEDRIRYFWTPFQILSLGVLREYLSVEFAFKNIKLKMPYDIERCIDDFVLMCFFVGNDFLPSLPSVGIHKGSIDQMIILYQKTLPHMSDYLTNEGKLNVNELKMFIRFLGEIENNVFTNDSRFLDYMKKKKKLLDEQQDNLHDNEISSNNKNDKNFEESRRLKRLLEAEDFTLDEPRKKNMNSDDFHRQCIDEFKSRLLAMKKKNTDILYPNTIIDVSCGNESKWRLNYYTKKFELDINISSEKFEEHVQNVCLAYVKGLHWVLSYYYQGIASWTWAYPYHYPPFASDIAYYCANTQDQFTLDNPFKPFEQLMAILPPMSANILPTCYANYMLNPDPKLAHYFPTKVKEDHFGRRYRWQWISLIPFIDQTLFLNAIKHLEATLNDEENVRNTFQRDYIYIDPSSSLKNIVEDVQTNKKSISCHNYTPHFVLRGTFHYSPIDHTIGNTVYHDILCPNEFPISTAKSLCCEYTYEAMGPHESKLLDGAEQITMNISELDFVQKCYSNSAFNSIPAKRMIIFLLGKLGIVSQDEIDTFKNNTNRQNYRTNVHSDNRYASETFHKSTLGQGSSSYQHSSVHPKNEWQNQPSNYKCNPSTNQHTHDFHKYGNSLSNSRIMPQNTSTYRENNTYYPAKKKNHSGSKYHHDKSYSSKINLNRNDSIQPSMKRANHRNHVHSNSACGFNTYMYSQGHGHNTYNNNTMASQSNYSAKESNNNFVKKNYNHQHSQFDNAITYNSYNNTTLSPMESYAKDRVLMSSNAIKYLSHNVRNPSTSNGFADTTNYSTSDNAPNSFLPERLYNPYFSVKNVQNPYYSNNPSTDTINSKNLKHLLNKKSSNNKINDLNS